MCHRVRYPAARDTNMSKNDGCLNGQSSSCAFNVAVAFQFALVKRRIYLRMQVLFLWWRVSGICCDYYALSLLTTLSPLLQQNMVDRKLAKWTCEAMAKSKLSYRHISGRIIPKSGNPGAGAGDAVSLPEGDRSFQELFAPSQPRPHRVLETPCLYWRSKHS
jgi:hypothetical protein